MSEKREVINNLLVVLFNNILTIEERALRRGEFKNMTLNELHVIEAIGIGNPKNMSQISADIGVTMGTLTTAMNTLIRKGYVTRKKAVEDKRVVLAELTESGKRAFEHHQAFHEEMVTFTMEGLEEPEMDVLVNTLSKLTLYFDKKYNPTLDE